jgi:RNA polymerase sigma-70 factor, ECF subfamily
MWRLTQHRQRQSHRWHELDDQLLVRHAQQGQTRAFDWLMARHAKPLYAFVHCLLHDTYQAEDLTAETFAQAYRSLGAFEGRSTFATWLRSIALHLCNSDRRRPRFEVCELELLDTDGANDHLVPSPIDDTVLALMVRGGLSALPFPQRAAVILFHTEGYTYREIATMLNVPVNTAKSHVHRGIANMRRILGDSLDANVGVAGGLEHGSALHSE